MPITSRTRNLPRKLIAKLTRSLDSHSPVSRAYFEINNLDPRIQVALGVELVANPIAPVTPITTFLFSAWPGVDGARDGVVWGHPLPGADEAECYLKINGDMHESATGVEIQTTAQRILGEFKVSGNPTDSIPGCTTIEVWAFCDLAIVGAVSERECEEILSRVTISDVKFLTATYGNV